MKNWLIKLLGGLTTNEFTEVFSLATKDREVMIQANKFYKLQCDVRQARIEYLENLILTKTGFIAPVGIPNETQQDFKPIGGNNTWGQVKRKLELHDQKLMRERVK